MDLPAFGSRSRPTNGGIDACYLFDARGLLSRQIDRGAKVGVAASVLAAEWEGAELYPTNRSGVLDLGQDQAAVLRLFAG